jgi:hexosaminidase
VTRGVVPRPSFTESLVGTVTWRSPLRVRLSNDQWIPVMETFADDLASSVGWRLELVGESDECDLEIRLLPELDDEEYQLVVAPISSIDAGSASGLAHALTTLRQLGPAQLWSSAGESLDSFDLACAVIQDGPEFAWRGLHLDVSRHFFDVDVVCRLIDLLALHRMNRLHLHLNDDQGWRVEIPGWPRLSSVGATRSSSPVGHEDEGRDDHVAYGGFYRADDLAAIRAHGEKRFVQIVPEIDLPGHAQAVLAAYPELGNGGAREVWTRWGISDHVLNVGAQALDFAEEAVLFVADLFPGSPVHIGGDECPTTEWESSELAALVMAEHGFVEVRELQGLFTRRMARALEERGHEVIAWDEVLDADVPTGTVIAAWRHADKAVEAAERGLDVIMAPMQYLYFDWLSSDEPDEPVALTRPPDVTTWERVYGFSVIPKTLAPALHHHVRGAQAQLWTEYISTRDHLDYMTFPRLCALSEVVWGTTTALEEFRPRLKDQLERLGAMGVQYRPLDEA